MIKADPFFTIIAAQEKKLLKIEDPISNWNASD